MPFLQLLVNFPGILTGILLKYGFFKKLGFEKEYLEGIKEGIATMRQCQKFTWNPENFRHYLTIEWELFAATFLYIYELSCRQIKKIMDR